MRSEAGISRAQLAGIMSNSQPRERDRRAPGAGTLSPGARAYWERRGLLPGGEDRSLAGLRGRRFVERCLDLGFRPARLLKLRQAAETESRELHQLRLFGGAGQPYMAELVVQEGRSCYEPGTGQQFLPFVGGQVESSVAPFPTDPDTALERLLVENAGGPDLEERLRAFCHTYPRSIGGCIELGNLLFSRGDYDGAAAVYRRSLELDPECAEACYNLAGCHVRKSEFAAAIRGYHRSVRLRPDFPEALFSLGVLYLTLSYRRHARQAFQAVLALGDDGWATSAGRFLRELDQPPLDDAFHLAGEGAP